MTRFNLVLLAILLACALGVVGVHHNSRKIYGELEKEQELSRQLEVEWGQLQIEQSTWATHARIDRIAVSRLGMAAPPSSRIQIVPSKSPIRP